jgi:hypothetical protein
MGERSIRWSRAAATERKPPDCGRRSEPASTIWRARMASRRCRSSEYREASRPPCPIVVSLVWSSCSVSGPSQYQRSAVFCDRCSTNSHCQVHYISRQSPHRVDSPVQRRDQLLELACELAHVHRHRRPPLGPVLRREAFQISPQPSHRQYVCSSTVRAVVVIEDDRHAGHTAGVVSAAAERDRCGSTVPRSREFIRPPAQTPRRSASE